MLSILHQSMHWLDPLLGKIDGYSNQPLPLLRLMVCSAGRDIRTNTNECVTKCHGAHHGPTHATAVLLVDGSKTPKHSMFYTYVCVRSASTTNCTRSIFTELHKNLQKTKQKKSCQKPCLEVQMKQTESARY